MSRNPPPPTTGANATNTRNEYIPDFIQKKPFFAEGLLDDNDYLEHQRNKAQQQDTLDVAKWYDRGSSSKAGPAATKYRKGACENCGAMTHKAKDCLSRPRKQGAKWTGRDIQADEKVQSVKLGWDAKRDRWNGYDAREYDGVVRGYEEMEALKKLAAGEGDEDGKYAEETDMGRNQPTSTRQLRLREDTAKYLVNLDLDSATYDPKTRSMDTTTQALNDNPSGDVASEGFVQPANDAVAERGARRYAWEATDQPIATGMTATGNIAPPTSGTLSSKVHLEANPTASAMNIRLAAQAEAERKATTSKALLDKYGSQTTYTTGSLSARPAASEQFVEYDAKTGLPKGQIKVKARSKYPEDVFPNNHKSVWGSWWREGNWGYACCWSMTKNSYCTGEDGKRAFQEEQAQKLGLTLAIENGSGDKRATEDDAEGESSRAKRAKIEN